MSDTAYRASSAVEQAAAYVAALLSALGSRDPLEVLREMPVTLPAAVSGLTEAELSVPERAGKWSVRQVAQHLADSELVGGFRFRMVLAHEQPVLPGYDQDLWAQRLRYQESDLETVLADFAALRRSNLRLLERATPEELRRVMRHAERGDESLAHMIRTYAGHDIVHLRQIARVRAAIGASPSPR